jgi:hypothetical protein
MASTILDKFSILWDFRARAGSTGKLHPITPVVRGLTGDFASVARSSPKTIIDKNGLLQTIGNNEPPLSYGTGGWGALVEGARTNLALWSEDLSNAFWTKRNVTETSIGGGAFSLTNNNVNGFHCVSRDSNLLSGVGAVSVDFRYSGSARFVFISAERNPTETDRGFYLDLLTEETRLNTADNYTRGVVIYKLTDGWFRVTCSVNGSNASQRQGLSFGMAFSLTNRFFESDGISVDVRYPQAEINATFASSYIKTEGATFTRNADVITKTGASDLIGQTEGFLYAVVDVRNLGVVTNRQVISVNNTGIFYQESGKFAVRSQTADNVSVGLTSIVVRYSNNFQNYTIYIDGEDEGSNTGSALGELNLIGIGIRGNTLDRHFNDRILLAGIGKTALTEAEAIALTSLDI